MKKTLAIALFFILSVFSLCAYADDPVVGAGKRVKLDYTLFVNNEQVETSIGNQPLTYTVGDNTIIPGLESQLNGMHVGEEKIVMVAPKDAYGDVDPKAFKEFPKASLPKGVEPKKGMVLQATSPENENFPAVVSEIKENTVVLDFNHPLAGKELKFKVKILSIENAPIPAVPAVPAVNAAPAEEKK